LIELYKLLSYKQHKLFNLLLQLRICSSLIGNFQGLAGQDMNMMDVVVAVEFTSREKKKGEKTWKNSKKC
jgi:hypothetical protein